MGERARFERFLSIVISYFDQNDLGGGRWERELDLSVFFLLLYLILIKMAFGGEVGESSI